LGSAELVHGIKSSPRPIAVGALFPDCPATTQQAIARECFKVAELCLIWASGAMAYELARVATPVIWKVPPPVSWAEFVGFLLLISVLTVLFASLRGLYASPWRSNLRRVLRLQAESLASAALIAGTCMYLWDITGVSKFLFVSTLVVSWAALAGWRRLVEAQPIAGWNEKRNVLIAGCDKNARRLRAHLEQNPELGFVVSGYLDRRQAPRPRGESSPEAEEGLLGGIRDLPAIVRSHFIDEIFVRLPRDRELVKQIANQAFATGVNVRVIPELCDGLTADQPIEFVGSLPTMTLIRRPTATLQLFAKRLLDVVVAATSLIALAPVFVLIALVIRIDSKGQVFYKSVRVGKKGQTFTCYKFRTMVPNADGLKESLRHLNERDAILFKIADDPRITRLGKFLRKFSLDELPQLWNVLLGEMSLVGPRPCVPSEYKQYTLEHLRRLDVVPGVTGLWQIEARKSPWCEDYLRLDKKYVEEWNLGLDFKILWKTVGVVVAGTGQ